MKKILLLLSLGLVALTGCKKDDSPASPVTDTVLPTSSAENPIVAGSAVTIQGKGFTQSSEIWLRALTKAAETDVQATVTAVTDASITFTAPAVSGEQGIILKQNGGEWSLGKMYFAPASDILPRKLVRIVSSYTDEDGETEEPSTYEYSYDEQGRLIKITDKSTTDDAPYITEIQYTENEITYNREEDKTVFSLKEGRVVSSEWTDTYSDEMYETTTFSYDATGFLNETVIDGTYTRKFTFKENSLTQVDSKGEDWPANDAQITPHESVRNNLNVDLCTELISFAANALDCEESILPYQLEIAGKRSAYLPKKCVSTDNDPEEGTETDTCTFDYTLDNDGYITEIRMEDTDGGSTVYQLFYEE